MGRREEIARMLQQNSGKLFTGRVCHPEPVEIARMIRLAQQALLPNYFAPDQGRTSEWLMDELNQVMAAQIHRSLFQKCLRDSGTESTRVLAVEKADDVIERLPEVQTMLFEDVVETFHGDPAATGYDEILLTYPGLFAIMVYRLAHVMVELQIPLLPRMMTEHAHQITGIDIHPAATIGRSLMIDHGTGIVIGETTVVGDHVKIYQGVTLGALYFPRDESGSMIRQTKRHPTVEDCVVLYANATVLGGDTVVGHHSTIGSNAWITESVPPNSRVLYQSENIVHTRRV